MIALLLLAASATLAVSPVEGTVGDPLEATITVATDGATVEATPVGPELGDVGVLEGSWQPPSGGTTLWKGRLAAWRVGEITVPPIEVGLARDGSREVVKTEPVTLTIRSVLDPKEAKPAIADLKPPAAVPPDWRPLRAFDDGRQTFIEFPPSLAVGEAPPLFLVDRKGEAQLVNYRLRGRYYIVDRLFDAAELRLGTKRQQVVRISRTGRSS